MFTFCLRVVGSSSCLTTPITSQALEADEITFTDDDLEVLDINNPLQFFGVSSSVCLCIHLTAMFASDNNIMVGVSPIVTTTHIVIIISGRGGYGGPRILY